MSVMAEVALEKGLERSLRAGCREAGWHLPCSAAVSLPKAKTR